MTEPDSAAADPRTVADEQADPRLARSRNRLLDAASHLLSTGGVEAVTVDAVTRVSKVARATLYRHFGSTTQLLAATFERLLPHVDTPTGDGPVRDQLIALPPPLRCSQQPNKLLKVLARAPQAIRGGLSFPSCKASSRCSSRRKCWSVGWRSRSR